ncbi:glycoside hydrolase family 99-like domain-containing protein [Pseudomonas nitroreducens]|uniref:Glycosyltransferase n=1 Tax=Pseudomonas nitroreducens TaxID=46680 RepID=A0A246FBY1_PSENT|nr:glycoside hydrolase family 99-like domain-containing protein [Pseudomonas nitroreducens]OWP51827.1 hypothetical protein CEG18_06045 [Pseudomonas nitroreducens]
MNQSNPSADSGLHRQPLAAFSQDAASGVWSNGAQKDFGYSDGDAAEQKVGRTVAGATDVSVHSAELIAQVDDWPSEYHFSPRRSNLLHWIDGLGQGTRVLELGCGCGAITRALAERGCQVDAVEGSPRRAGIAARRVQAFADVRVFHSNFQDIAFEPVYDVVTLIGVLEYSPVYLDAEDAFVACLQMAERALKPGGVLVVAIENQMGLKYFSGITEDHFAKAYYGVEGRYGHRQTTTYGRRRLAAKLAAAGFTEQHFAYPFPDYKLPEVVVGDAGVARDGFAPEDLVAYLENRDYSGVGAPQFNLPLAWEGVAKEGLLGDLANSFLILAHRAGDCRFVRRNLLAQKYTDNRRPGLNCITSFVEQDGEVRVQKSPLGVGDASSELVSQSLHEQAYVAGRNLGVLLRNAILREQSDIVVALLNHWLAELTAHARDGELPSGWLDATPDNFILQSDGSLALIDDEWRTAQPISLSVLFYRGLQCLAADATVARHLPGADEMARVAELCQWLSLEFSEAGHDEASRLNRRLWQEIYGNGRWRVDMYRRAGGRPELEALPATPQADQAHKVFEPRLIAFHLPQFHRIEQNDNWWGEGFTEWSNVRQGAPLFEGHYQPHVPTAELGYYDLADVATLERQARMALEHGLHGFCFYYYWFDGERLLERPVDQLLANPQIDLPFCLCWANENWTRRWDGGEQEILMHQSYSPQLNPRFAADLVPYMSDPRYIRVGGKPVLLVYRGDIIPDLPGTLAAWRQHWREAGVGEVYLIGVESFQVIAPAESGFDATCEFLPHQVRLDRIRSPQPLRQLKDASIHVGDYEQLAQAQLARPAPGYKRFRGLVPGWDNAARRRKGGATMFVGSTPERYQRWLERTLELTAQEQQGDERLVFINAWNEWGEGCHLEPDERFGMAYLQATRDALANKAESFCQPARTAALDGATRQYREWLAHRELSPVQRATLEERVAGWSAWPRVSAVILDKHSDARSVQATLDSLDAQLYLAQQTLVISDAPAQARDGLLWLSAGGEPMDVLGLSLEALTGDWVQVLVAGDRLDAHALLVLAERINLSPDMRCCYYDEDQLLDSGHAFPLLKPDFNLDLLRSYPYTGSALAFQRSAAFERGGIDRRFGDLALHDLLLRLVESTGFNAVGHIAEILLHTRQGFGAWLAEAAAGDNAARLVSAHLDRLGLRHEIYAGAVAPINRVQYLHEQQPKVSILIPTRDQLPILQRCVESVLEKTRYPHYEILIIDNDSQAADACAWLAGIEQLDSEQVRVLRYPHPFNYSAINNFAAKQATGDYLVLLNNDTAALQEDWLEAMLHHAQREEVGIVGARLLFPDGRLQHGGVVLGLNGPADHVFIGDPGHSPGYMHRLFADQNYSAVTAACLMIRKSLYEELGGMDEEDFKVSYNDVDLCLKARQAGYLSVWTPYAVLLHEGSVSQTHVDSSAQQAKRARFKGEQQAMYRHWLPALAEDAAYNRNLSLRGKGFTLDECAAKAWQPLVQRVAPSLLLYAADDAGCGHYRVRQPFAAMRRDGLLDGVISANLLETVEEARLAPDAVIFQRQITARQLEIMGDLRASTSTFRVYEVDDYLPNLPLKSAHQGEMPRDILRSLRQAVSLCDRFVVSTQALAEAFADLHGDIRVRPNLLPVEWWKDLSSQRRVGRKPRVGWAGGMGHGGDLQLIADVVRELANEVEWVFFGLCPEALRPYIAEFHPGRTIEDYPQRLASMNLDLALAPLEQNRFNECKSNLRLLEYGVLGYPVVCSDVRCYQGDLPVTRVKNRYRDWVEAIRMHLADLDATARAGDALREVVRRDWMLEGEKVVDWARVWLPD